MNFYVPLFLFFFLLILLEQRLQVAEERRHTFLQGNVRQHSAGFCSRRGKRMSELIFGGGSYGMGQNQYQTIEKENNEFT